MDWVLIITFLYLGQGVAMADIPMETKQVCQKAAVRYIANFKERKPPDVWIEIHAVCVKTKGI